MSDVDETVRRITTTIDIDTIRCIQKLDSINRSCYNFIRRRLCKSITNYELYKKLVFTHLKTFYKCSTNIDWIYNQSINSHLELLYKFIDKRAGRRNEYIYSNYSELEKVYNKYYLFNTRNN